MYINDLVGRSINTGLSLLIIIIFSLIVYLFSKKRFDSQRQKSKFKYRIVYISSIAFLLVLVRIWIEGFTHIFTMLSLVAAGLVVANKESIMNITGWLIINWRGLFTSGDGIQILNITGYIVSVKLLYFKIYETTSLGNNIGTGKIIKIPNAMIISNPVIIFTSDDYYLLHSINISVDSAQDIAKLVKYTATAIAKILAAQYKGDDLSHKKHHKKEVSLSTMISAKPVVELKSLPDKCDVLTLKTSFYCKPQDVTVIEQALMMSHLNFK